MIALRQGVIETAIDALQNLRVRLLHRGHKVPIVDQAVFGGRRLVIAGGVQFLNALKGSIRSFRSSS